MPFNRPLERDEVAVVGARHGGVEATRESPRKAVAFDVHLGQRGDSLGRARVRHCRSTSRLGLVLYRWKGGIMELRDEAIDRMSASTWTRGGRDES